MTLECIRRYYRGENSPLFPVLQKDKDFFDLFVDFKGYVNFFYLQDCVNAAYSKVNIWCGDMNFIDNPLPKTDVEYLLWIDKNLEFVEKRNQRIQQAINSEKYY